MQSKQKIKKQLNNSKYFLGILVVTATFLFYLSSATAEDTATDGGRSVSVLQSTTALPVDEMPDICGLDSVVCPDEQLEVIITKAAIKHGVKPEVMLALAKCESQFDTEVRGEVDPRDRGLFQINSRWNPSVTDECAFDAECSSNWSAKEIKEGRLWKWVCAKEV